jgi:hypothetical protein
MDGFLSPESPQAFSNLASHISRHWAGVLGAARFISVKPEEEERTYKSNHALDRIKYKGRRGVSGGKEKPACAGFLKKKQKRNSITLQ